MSESTAEKKLREDNDEDAEVILCPVLRGAVNEGRLSVDKKGVVKFSELKGVMATFGMPQIFCYVAAFSNKLSDVLGNLFGGRFNIHLMRGGLIDHTCATGILSRGQFDEVSFDEMVSHASTPGRLTKSDFNEGVKQRKKEREGTRAGAWLSELEFSILLKTFGKKGEDGELSISIADLRQLYEHGKLPGKMIIQGKLIHEEATENGQIAGVRVELWHRRQFFLRSFIKFRLGQRIAQRFDRHVATYERTDKDGSFRFELAGEQTFNLQLRIVDTRRTVTRGRRKILSILDSQDRVSESLNLGSLRIPLWEYDRTYPFPVLLARTYDDKLPQPFSPGVKPLIALTYVRLHSWHWARKWFFGWGSLSLEQVQRSFPVEARTKKNQDADSDEYFVYRIINGFNPAKLRKVSNSEEDDECEISGRCEWLIDEESQKNGDNSGEQYLVEVDFKKYESDGYHDLTNAKLFLKLQDGKLEPTRVIIKVRGKEDTKGGDPQRKETLSEFSKCYSVTPGHPKWHLAKRAFRSAWAAEGEFDAHLAAGHLNVGQYAIAAYRNFFQSPLKELLLPYLRGVTKINDDGKDHIFGVKGVLSSNTALTTSAAWRRLAEHLGTLDWNGWHPPKPVYDGHTYARAANIFWEATKEYVDEFFEKNGAEIEHFWYEVKRFSDDLGENSVAVNPQNSEQTTRISEQERIGEFDSHPPIEQIETLTKYDLMFHSLSDHSESIEPQKRALGVITDIPDVEELRNSAKRDSQIQNLKQVCRYIIFHATFWHGWTNDLQITDVGNVFHTPLALRNGSMSDNQNVLPTPDEAVNQLVFANLLSKVKVGRIMLDKLDEIDSCFKDILERKRDDFAALKNDFEDDRTFDIDNIRSRTNI